MSRAPAEACERYLALLGEKAQLAARPYGLHAHHDDCLTDFQARANAFLASMQGQLEGIGLAHRLYFGLLQGKVDESDNNAGDQEAYAVTDPFSSRTEVASSFLLFTLPFARDIFTAWDALLSRTDIFEEIGQPGLEASTQELSGATPTDPVRARYARDQALLTLEFALYHEYYHVASGHLAALKQQGWEARMHAVTSADGQAKLEARKYKVLELDADVSALRHLTNDVQQSDQLVAHEVMDSATGAEKFRHIGRCITLLYRLIELWRRNDRLDYRAEDAHPHPDVRDAVLETYMRVNAVPDDEALTEQVVKAYKQGKHDVIEALPKMNELAPNFDVVKGMGQELAIQETSWLIPELNRLRKAGVCEEDFRRAAARFKAAGAGKT